MTAALAALLFAPAMIELAPTDDVWAYPHAADQTSDQYLRAWGSEGTAIGKIGVGQTTFSYSLLKFELPAGMGKVKSAKLTLWSIAKPAWTVEDSKKFPLEVRRLAADFEEENWTFANAEKAIPLNGEGEVYGVGSFASIDEEKPFSVTIDLMKGKASFTSAVAGAKTLRLGLTTKLDPEEAGEGRLYKLFSRSAENKAVRPKLVMELE